MRRVQSTNILGPVLRANTVSDAQNTWNRTVRPTTQNDANGGATQAALTISSSPQANEVESVATTWDGSENAASHNAQNNRKALAPGNVFKDKYADPSLDLCEDLESALDAFIALAAARPPILTLSFHWITDPTEEEFTESPSMMSKRYLFLEGMRVVTLKQICEHLSMKKTRNKGDLVERILVTTGHMGSGSEYQKDVAALELFYQLDCRLYDAWIADKVQRGI